MRHIFAAVVAVLCMGTAIADEPAACYISHDPTGDFASSDVQPSEALPGVGAQVRHLMNQDNRAFGRCMQKHVEREGTWPSGAGILYGARISPEGKVTQVSVLASRNINDALLMACVGRLICKWELEPSADNKERLIAVPPFGTPERLFNSKY